MFESKKAVSIRNEIHSLEMEIAKGLARFDAIRLGLDTVIDVAKGDKSIYDVETEMMEIQDEVSKLRNQKTDLEDKFLIVIRKETCERIAEDVKKVQNNPNLMGE